MSEQREPLSADADALLEIVTTRAADFSRKAADDLYAALLDAAQDYLIDNARFNIGEKIASAQRQARHDREERGKTEARVRVAADLLAELLEHSIAHYGNPTDETYGVGLVHARARSVIAAARSSRHDL